tara:strand:+ start:381 stop:629 length:249 start_codon:yes stop_codon:yes gene_type:complete
MNLSEKLKVHAGSEDTQVLRKFSKVEHVPTGLLYTFLSVAKDPALGDVVILRRDRHSGTSRLRITLKEFEKDYALYGFKKDD